VQIFLSHSHRDADIAHALASLVGELFGGRVQLAHSSDQRVGGGIRPGEHWLRWIMDRVRTSAATYVLLTPNSLRQPWVLWESGAAAGVALATELDRPVVPIAFGISDREVPSPFAATQVVRGDIRRPNGIERLLSDLNHQLDAPLPPRALQSTLDDLLPNYLETVRAAMSRDGVAESILASVPSLLDAHMLAGYWATCFEFTSRGQPRCHADIAEISAQSNRRLIATNQTAHPRTEGRQDAFVNEISAEVVNRHVLGFWKNVGDARYFGAIHLAVLAGANVMEGHYTTFSNDILAEAGSWKWVRIDPGSIEGRDLATVSLRPAQEVSEKIRGHGRHAPPLHLSDLIEGSP
jgi:hypothetical protein